MDPRRKAASPLEDDVRAEGPALEEQEWDDLERAAPFARRARAAERVGDPAPPTGEARDEEDDNPYQHSDEALPDDRGEAVLRRNPSREGGHFDEV